jgi:hypothetical protein
VFSCRWKATSTRHAALATVATVAVRCDHCCCSRRRWGFGCSSTTATTAIPTTSACATTRGSCGCSCHFRGADASGFRFRQSSRFHSLLFSSLAF